MVHVELINTGTELLMGFVMNTHAAYLGQRLNELGATLVRQITVNDCPKSMKNAVKQAMKEADLVLTTGGLGPTGDDLTRNCIVKILRLRTQLDRKAMGNIEGRFHRNSIAMPESVKCQAIVPKIATVFYNDHGTAPGLAIPLKRKGARVRWIVMLPGPPGELKPMFEKNVVPLIHKEFGDHLPPMDCRIFRVVGLGESTVEERLAPQLKSLTNLEIGYCARSGEVDVRLITRGDSESEVKRIGDEAEKQTRLALGNNIFGTGNQTLEEMVVSLLRAKKKGVVTVESCTGGCLANRITMVPRSSEAFLQGWVTYSDNSKIQLLGVPSDLIRLKGAVSEPVAKCLAEGALQRSTADYALSITGIAGPSGGSAEKPVGTVFIALASKQETQVEKFFLPFDRETFKFVVTQNALNMLRLSLLTKS